MKCKESIAPAILLSCHQDMLHLLRFLHAHSAVSGTMDTRDTAHGDPDLDHIRREIFDVDASIYILLELQLVLWILRKQIPHFLVVDLKKGGSHKEVLVMCLFNPLKDPIECSGNDSSHFVRFPLSLDTHHPSGYSRTQVCNTTTGALPPWCASFPFPFARTRRLFHCILSALNLRWAALLFRTGRPVLSSNRTPGGASADKLIRASPNSCKQRCCLPDRK